MSQQRYAYLMGANGPEQMALRYAESDALRLAEVLIGPFCQFTEAKAVIALSRDAGLAGLQALARRCDPSDTLLVHFSGHAIFDRHLYLLSNTTDCDNLYVTAIDIRTVKDILSDCLAHSKLLILDCCHAKGAYEEALKGEEDIHDIVRHTAQGSSLAILSACARKDGTREFRELDGGSGFLSWAVRAACRGDFAGIPFDLDHQRTLSLSDLERWIRKALDYINATMNIHPPLPTPYMLRDQTVGHEILLTPPLDSEWRPSSVTEEENRRKYLEQVCRTYSSVALPIGPTEGLSLHAIFQPLALRSDPVAAEDLERRQRRKLLGEQSQESGEARHLERPRIEQQGDFLGEKQATAPFFAEHGEDALGKSPQGRVVILGGPGTGKTTTLKYLVSRRASQALEKMQGPSTALLPIFLSLADLARSGKTLQSYLVDVVEGMKVDKSFAAVLWTAIERRQAFIALDSLDEVPPAQRSQMIALVNSLAADLGNIWLVGSRFTDYKSGQLKAGQFAEWELLSMTPELRRELAEKLFPELRRLLLSQTDGRSSPSDFVNLLEHHPQAAPWGDNPLLFSLATAVYVKTGGLPLSRAVLYQQVIEAVLTLKEPDSVARKHLLRALTGLALWLYEQKKGRTFTLHELLTYLEDIRDHSWEEAERIAKKITTSGVLDIVARETYGFRHQTFQEYLAAAELAHMLMGHDEQKRGNALTLAWRKRTYSRWTELLCLMVGVLANEHGKAGIRTARQWLQQLASQYAQPEGDPGSLGLSLMLKSAREITLLDGEPGQATEIRALERDMITLWLQDVLDTAGSDHEAREKRLRELAADIALLHPATVAWTVEQLVQLLGDEKPVVAWTAIETLGFFGGAVPLAPLITILFTGSWSMRMAALRTLKALKRLPSLEQCAELFNDDDWELRQALIEAIGAVRNPLFGSLLVDALADEREEVRNAAIHALGDLAQDAPVTLLLSVLRTASPELSGAVAASLGRLGQYAPVGDLLDALHQVSTCQQAAKALGMLGAYAPVSSLIEATRSSLAEVRASAAMALGTLKNSLALLPLTLLLQDANRAVRRAAIEAIEEIVEPVSTSGFLDISGYFRWHFRWRWMNRHRAIEAASALPIEPIVAATKDEDRVTRLAALRISALFGEHAPLDSLLDALRDDDYHIRREAIRALGMVGMRVPVEVFVNALEDENWEVCEAATETLGALGQRAPVDDLMSITDKKRSVNIAIAVLRACGMLGQYAPIKVVIEALNDDDHMSVHEATRALAEIEPWIDAQKVLSALEKNTKPLLLPAIQVLGALQNEASLDALLSVLETENGWLIRKAVIQALSHWEKRMPVELLREIFDHVENLCGEITLSDGSTAYYMWAPSVCVEVLKALVKLKEDAPLDVIAQAVTNKNEVVRQTAVHAVGALSAYLSDVVLFETLEEALEDESLELHLQALRILSKRGIKVSLKRLKAAASERDLSALCALNSVGQHALLQSIIGGKSLVEWLTAALFDARENEKEPFDCLNIILALAETEDAAAVNPLIAVLEGRGFTRDDYDGATEALGGLLACIPIHWFVEKLKSGDEWLIEKALWVLHYWPDDTTVPQTMQEQIPLEPLVTALYNQEEEKTRAGATTVLGMIGARAPVELLLTALGDTSVQVRESAIKALRESYPEVLSSFQAEARAVLDQQQAPGAILGSPGQSFIAWMIGEMGLASPPYLQKLQELLFWPHWQVQFQAIRSFRTLHRPIPDAAIQQLLYLRQHSPARSVRQAADDALAELLTLETGIEED
jgi:HEAT repeat protein